MIPNFQFFSCHSLPPRHIALQTLGDQERRLARGSRTTLRNKMFHIENLEELCLVLKVLLVVDYNIAFLLSFLLFQPAAPERKLSIQSSTHLTNSDEDDSRTGSPDQGMHNMYHVSQANTVFYIVHCAVLFPAWRDEHNERFLICLFVCLF